MKILKSTAIAAIAFAAAIGTTVSSASAEDQCLSYNMGDNQLSYCRNNVEPIFPSIFQQPVAQPQVIQAPVYYTQPAPIIIERGPNWQLRKEVRLLRRMERNAYLTRAERKRIKRKIRRKAHRLHGHKYGRNHARVAARRAHRKYDSVYAD